MIHLPVPLSLSLWPTFVLQAKLNIWLEMEIGITGGVEDGVDNSGVPRDKLPTVLEVSAVSVCVSKCHLCRIVSSIS